MRVLLLIGLWVLLLAAGVIVGIALRRRRAETLQVKASVLGFAYHAVAKPFLGTRVDALAILEDGASTEVENVLECEDCRFKTVIFDEYIASDTAGVATTFAAFQVTDFQLPVFSIGSRDFLERMEEALGKKTLKIDCDSDFAAHFYVQCEDEAATREFLRPRKLPALCVHARHFHIETSPDWLLMYRPDVTVAIDDVGEFVRETTAIAEALLARDPMPLPASA